MGKPVNSKARAHEVALDAHDQAMKKLAGKKPSAREEAVMNQARRDRRQFDHRKFS